jgi:hypothetical protein
MQAALFMIALTHALCAVLYMWLFLLFEHLNDSHVGLLAIVVFGCIYAHALPFMMLTEFPFWLSIYPNIELLIFLCASVAKNELPFLLGVWFVWTTFTWMCCALQLCPGIEVSAELFVKLNFGCSKIIQVVTLIAGFVLLFLQSFHVLALVGAMCTVLLMFLSSDYVYFGIKHWSYYVWLLLAFIMLLLLAIPMHNMSVVVILFWICIVAASLS